MKKVTSIIVGVLGTVAIGAMIFGGSIWGNRNDIVSVDETIKSQLVANKSNYDNMWKRFVEEAQVTDKQAKQFKETYEGIISGRYGNDKNVILKLVQESNPQLNQETYVQLQRDISAARISFDNNQKSIADMVGEYNRLVRKHVVTTYIFGFKTKDANEFIVTSDRTDDAFTNKKDDAIKLN